MRCIDLFGGIGGFRLGLEQASDTRFDCVWYCDKDKYSCQTYNKNFKTQYEPTDITTIDAADIPDFDMLCAGFPCQSFSIAGKRKGFQDIRGTMFFEIYRILQEKKPRLLFLENVKGLLSADDGKCFATIISSLDELGYDVEWQVLNSKNFGVPQNRERVFIIGHLRGTGGQQVFPLRKCIETYIENNKQERWDRVETSLALRGGARQRYDGETLIVRRMPLKYMNRNQKNIQGDYSFTIDGANTGGVSLNNVIRRLTPVECERLQGFPDNWTQGVSDTQRYKQLGNAVTVNVIKAIGENLN